MRTTKSIETYLVGGAVRDSLLGLSSADKDWVVVGSNSAEMIKLGFQQVGKDFPVFLHPSTHEEYALARQERKSSSGHTGFQVHTHSVSLEEDLSRRDLTINAIAQKEDGTIIDPHGGVPDIDKRVLRHVSNAFREDPLRVLRIARFAAQLAKFDFKVAPETLALLKSMSSSEELSTLSAERIWKETEKALRSDRPRIYFEVLRSAGALKVLFPEIEALFGVPQRPKFHPEIDAGLHTLLSLDRITEQSNDPRLRFAVLTHDIGKATTPKDLLPDHSGHEERSAELTEVLCQRLKTPNAYRKLAVIVARHHLACHRALRLSSSKIEELLSVLDAWGDNPRVSDFTQCCMADARGRTGLESRIYPQVEFLGECTKAARNTSAKALISQGYSGADLGKQLKISRANLIEPIIAKYAHIDELKYAKKESNTA